MCYRRRHRFTRATLFHANPDGNDVYFSSDIKAGLKSRKIWNINTTIKVLGKEVCQLLPFVHAFTGCDTTSRIYGVGKNVALKKVRWDQMLRQQASVFLKSATKQDIEQAGEAVFVSLFNGEQCQGLDLLRYCQLLYKVQTKKSVVLIQSLPPTSSAARFHSYRVFFTDTNLARTIFITT